MLFDNISPKTDFYSKIQSQLDILNGNVLYLTHEIDKVRKELATLGHDKDLQTTVDKYFERDETSPQTDSDEQNSPE